MSLGAAIRRQATGKSTLVASYLPSYYSGSCGHHHHPRQPSPTQNGGINTLNRKPRKGRLQDPTKTKGLRHQYEKELEKRFRRVMKSILSQIGKKNEFGLVVNKKYAFATDQAKVAAFQSWFEKAINKALFGNDLSRDFDRAAEKFWGNSFANIAYRRGLLKAVADIKRSGGKVSDAYIKDAMSQGFHADTLKRLYQRQFDDLRGITNSMSKKIGEALADGLAKGKGPMELARIINDRVEKIGITRARLMARTEIISAFDEASLNVFDQAGIIGIELEPELLTAGDDRVCDICEEAARQAYTVETARGVLPLHPNCRCAWAPMIKNGREIDLR